RAIALAAERAFEIAAGVIENIAAAPVDEFQESEHRVAEAETVADCLVDLFRAGDAFLHHTRRLVHGECLDAWHDEARCRRAYHRHLTDTFEQGLRTRDDRGIGHLARRYLHQGDQIGRIEPMYVEEAFGTVDRSGEIVDQDRGR